MKTVDLLILGGGCAGLSLACALARRGFDGQALLIEPRRHYVRDRTWGYWSVREHPFASCVTHRWHQWSLQAGAAEVRQHSTRYAYEHLPADAFYREALRQLAAAPGITLWRGVRASGLRRLTAGLEVESSRGRVRASRVVDTRPPSPPPPGPRPGLRQQVRGWQVRTTSPAFDAACVRLMDFAPVRDREIAFFYVLPYTRYEALVERATLTTRPDPDPDAEEQALRAYLGKRLGIRDYRIGYREQGWIPMYPVPPPPQTGWPGYQAGGTRGGLVRTGSGYAFLAIQRWSQAWAACLDSGQSPRPYSRLANGLDRIFLHYLATAPAAAPGAFLDFFSGAGPERAVRFLADEAGPGDLLAVLRALPARPLLRAALEVGLGWRGAGSCPSPP